MQVHERGKPYYCDHFSSNNYEVIVAQLQSERGSRFIKKGNCNIIIEVEEEVPVYENFGWISLGEIFQLLRIGNFYQERLDSIGLSSIKPNISYSY